MHLPMMAIPRIERNPYRRKDNIPCGFDRLSVSAIR
jgi:hypothetical protein